MDVQPDDIQLNFINQSNDFDAPDIVILQKNVAAGYGEDWVVAWRVIRGCGRGDNYPFVYSPSMEIGVIDGAGNDSPRLDAEPNQAFAFAHTEAGDRLSPAGDAEYPTEIQLRNDLPKSKVTACLYRSGALAAIEPVEPGGIACFQFNPTLWIGAVKQAEEGEVLDPAVVESIDTEFSLLGIASADIVMTGGGPGPNAQPLSFTLQNIARA